MRRLDIMTDPQTNPEQSGAIPVLPTLNGTPFDLESLRGKRVLLFMWGSWWRCRDQLPGWQRFATANRDSNFALVSAALEHSGSEAARSFVEAAGATFPTIVDEQGALSRQFGFKVVPNGVLIDPEGIVRWTKFGGFSIENPEDVAVVERFLAGEAPDPGPAQDVPYTLGARDQELVAAKVRLGRELMENNRRAEAVSAWRDALRVEPENFIIRKQIWAAEHPGKFFPKIDFAWQQEQLAAERGQEIADGVCGPDGCPLPQTTAAANAAEADPGA
jgi:peroxiredoxin